MRPVLFELFEAPVPAFGVAFAAAVLIGLWLTWDRLTLRGVSADRELKALILAVAGGVIGARIWAVAEGWVRNRYPSDASLLDALIRGGLTWYGGLLTGLVVLTISARAWDRSPVRVFHAMAPGIAFAQGIGRIGCLLVGDDYGKPTDTWVGIAFPEGSPPTSAAVHPTQLYEMAWLFGAGMLIWSRWDRSPAPFAEYLVLAGLGRFSVEFLRTNPPFLGPFSNAHTIALASMLTGGIWWVRARRAQV